MGALGDRRKLGLAAICALALAWGLQMHSGGWAQSAHYGEVRALAAGQPEIDAWHWEGMDKAWIDGHFYSVKAPGLALLTTPVYAVIEAAGGLEVARDAAANARRAAVANWIPQVDPPHDQHGFSAQRELDTERQVEEGTPVIWALGLFGAVLPALALLLAVRWVADRVAPGYGTAAAIALGLCTILMVFAAEYFSHAIAAACAFGAFALLFRERAGPPRAALVAGAGALAGLAVTFEYPLGLAGAIVFVYAISRGRRLPRAAAYFAGALIGVLPILAFNLWAFGDPLQLAYADAVSVQGLTGHHELGLNDDGFFGITPPRPGAAIDLLLADRGLLVLTPILAMAAWGLLRMRRGEFRAEANVIAAVAIAYFLYNAGYWQPFGGGTPGPRFLVPALPFLAIPLAIAFRERRALALALAVPSAVCMVAGALTYPLLGNQGVDSWVEQLHTGDIEHTVLTAIGVTSNWVAVAPVLLAIATAVALAARATPSAQVGPLREPLAVLGAWFAVFALGPVVAGDSGSFVADGPLVLELGAIGAVAALATLVVLRRRELRAPSRAYDVGSPREPALEAGSIS